MGFHLIFKLIGMIYAYSSLPHYLAYEAHSVAVDPQTHRVYFPLQNVNGHGVLRIMAPTL